MTQNVSRADLVAQYNSMSLTLGRGVVKDFKSKAVAEQRIAAIKPDFEAYLQDLEAKNGAATGTPATDAVAQPAPVIEMVNVVLHNNDNTAQWDVTHVLSTVFGLSLYECIGDSTDGPAFHLMMEANDKGSAVIGTYPRSRAEDLMQKVAAELERLTEKRDYRWQYVKELKFTIEPVPAKEQVSQ